MKTWPCANPNSHLSRNRVSGLVNSWRQFLSKEKATSSCVSIEKAPKIKWMCQQDQQFLIIITNIFVESIRDIR